MEQLTVNPTILHTEGVLRARQPKVLSWSSIHSGDCQQDHGQLLFHSDGTGTWSCTVLTYRTHTHDVWHSRFDVKGANGAILFSLGTFNGPQMSDGNPPPHYPWIAQFAFNPDFFDAIASASQHSNC